MSDAPKIPSIDHWNVTETLSRPVFRRFELTPKERLVLDYRTFERYRGRIINVVAPCEVIDAAIWHAWDEERGEWKSGLTLNIFELNPATMSRYSYRNPKSARISLQRDPWIDPNENVVGIDHLSKILLDATRPQSRITLIEEPIDA